VSVTATVIIVTLDRPDCVRRCLACLAAQRRPPEQIIVVDASSDERTRRVVEEFPPVLYLRNDNGIGRMTASRNIALARSTGEIIAFLDDDAFAATDWLERLLEPYADPSVGEVGGRALNKQPGEERTGVDKVGRLDRNGVLHGYFAADTGKPVEVDHVMGCNMSFRRSALAELGGFREDYPGISGLCEDSDMSLRVRALGHRIVFTPHAVVEHLGAPQAIGRRFDLRYTYFARRNQTVLLVRNFGLLSVIVWRNLVLSCATSVLECARKMAGAVARYLVASWGTASGLWFGISLLAKSGRSPVRRDPDGRKISAQLGESGAGATAGAVAAGPLDRVVSPGADSRKI
jgi:GT2 family glycosyltransferase